MAGKRQPPYRPLPDDDPVAIYDLWMAGRIRRMPIGFWRDYQSARAVVNALWERNGITPETAPMICRNDWFRQRLGTLLVVYRGSPSLLLMTLYPGRYQPADFPELPKAVDLKMAAFAVEGIPYSENPSKRWDASQRLRSAHQRKCQMCDRPLASGRLCDEHLTYYRAKYRARYAEWRAEDLCYRCGCRPPAKAGACQPCYGRILVTRARERRKHYWTNKALRLCGHWRCNKPAEAGFVNCAAHRAEERERYRRLNYRDKARLSRQAKRRTDT